MIFVETPLRGAWVVELEPIEDERGSFTRAFDSEEFTSRGLNAWVAQCSISFNRRRGTLRGMHYQAAPYAECKLVRCTRGAIFDVIVDLRNCSSSYRRWFSVELTPENNRLLYVPEGFAHGFQTLEDATEVTYQISKPYMPAYARGIRFDDPAAGIKWPLPITAISKRDSGYPHLDE